MNTQHTPTPSYSFHGGHWSSPVAPDVYCTDHIVSSWSDGGWTSYLVPVCLMHEGCIEGYDLTDGLYDCEGEEFIAEHDADGSHFLLLPFDDMYIRFTPGAVFFDDWALLFVD